MNIFFTQKHIFKMLPLEHMTNTSRNNATSSTIGLITTKDKNININLILEV